RARDQHHPAASELKLDRLIRAAFVLENLIEPGDTDIGSVMFDVDRYVGIFDEDPFDAVTHEEQLARGEISVRRDVVAGGCERSQRLVLQTAFRKCDAQWIHVSPDRRW